MPIVAKGGSDKKFEPCPQGLHRAVCCDVVDKGLVVEDWGDGPVKKHKVQLRWQVEATDDDGESLVQDDGRPFMVFATYTLSLHEKANLRRDLESWRGRPFTDAELEGFDLETLIGVNCQLQITHNHSKGNTYANVKGIVSAAKGQPKLQVMDYTRVCESVDAERQSQAMDDDVPF